MIATALFRQLLCLAIMLNLFNEGLAAQGEQDCMFNSQNKTFTVKGVDFTMIAVDGGTFQMGSDSPSAQLDQKPLHEVTLSDFFIGETEVTQALWTAVTGQNPSEFKSLENPVDSVTKNEAKRFSEKLDTLMHSLKLLPEQWHIVLPTEAEWEYAAKGGRLSRGYRYSGSDDIDSVAWTRNNSDLKTHRVASKKPNELGLFDMSGNVWEWVEDDYYPYFPQAVHDPLIKNSTKSQAIKRGGSWYYSQTHRFEPSYRYPYYKDVTDSSIGLRLVLRQCKDIHK
ncbi:formylglycine-generating enzyme family protein [Turicimonas muris]|uniref:formylglycine-generating enzyme family protein n=2 Tax=Turicimonas muris TaxID=1796652 RepID=UPI0023F3685D|nr:SUMF1/EgtB/PvdO family nonheme iron enzyme [Turicimonas muris]